MTFRSLPRVALCLLVATASLSAAQRPASPAVEGTVYLTPTCGCCGKWVEHMNAAGFKLKREVTTDMQTVAAHRKVPEPLHSCHTAVIGPYIIEGHVPADLIKKLLKEQPKIAGLAAPGMPAGSPGMDVPDSPSYTIVAFRADGTTYEYARR